MDDSLNNLLNLIDDATPILSENVSQLLTKSGKKSSKRLLTKPKVDKAITKMVYDEKSPVFMINCDVCKRENTWKEAARVGWIYNNKIMRYICPNCR